MGNEDDEEMEIALTLADMEDDEDFKTRWNEWSVKDSIPLEAKALRSICRIWFGRGIERGSEWALSDFERRVEAEKQ